jgi:hypothetical protein
MEKPKELKMEKDNIARLTHESYGQKQTIEFEAGCGIHDYMDFIERLLIAASFHPNSVKDGFIEKAAEIEECERCEECCDCEDEPEDKQDYEH